MDRPKCTICKKNWCRKNYRSGGYTERCDTCSRSESSRAARMDLKIIETRVRLRPWLRFKKGYCEECGFIPVHSCQLDVDHMDGNKKNNSEENLKTLCANCHRLKTWNAKEFGRKREHLNKYKGVVHG